MSVQIPDQTYKWLLEGLAATCNADTEICSFETCPFWGKGKKCSEITEQDWHDFFTKENELEKGK